MENKSRTRAAALQTAFSNAPVVLFDSSRLWNHKSCYRCTEAQLVSNRISCRSKKQEVDVNTSIHKLFFKHSQNLLVNTHQHKLLFYVVFIGAVLFLWLGPGYVLSFGFKRAIDNISLFIIFIRNPPTT